MFTGIVEKTAKLINLTEQEGSLWLLILELESSYINDVKLGDSIAVNGCCLTVVDKANDSLSFQLSKETFYKTNFASVSIGDLLNVERSMQINNRLDGHLVTGHIDTVASVLDFARLGECYELTVAMDSNIACYIAVKGSVTLNGVSLTINEVLNDSFKLMIIPHTLSVTNLSQLQAGSKLNLEVDILARYVHRQLSFKDK